MPADFHTLAAAIAPSADSYAADLDAGILDGEGDVVLDAGADVNAVLA